MPGAYSVGDIALHLFDPITRGGAHIENVTRRLKGYKRSIRDRGGPWQASAFYEGTLDEQRAMFVTSLMGDFQERSGGLKTWRGFISRLEFIENGIKVVRDYFDAANAYRSIYSQIGENLLTNASLESGLTWTQDGTPSIFTLIGPETWVIDGVNALHLAATNGEGVLLDNGGGIPISSGVPYDVSVFVKNISGAWKLVVYKDVSPFNPISETTFNALGDQLWTTKIDAAQPYTGNVGVRIRQAGANGELYADNATFTTSPFQASTPWITDDIAIDRWGRIERILLRGVMTTASALDEIETELNYSKWPWIVPPQRQTINQLQGLQNQQRDGLTIHMSGYCFLMNNLHALVGSGQQPIDIHLTNWANQTPFITPGIIAQNSRNYKLDDRAPRSLWSAALDVARKGDNAGNRYSLNVDTDLQLNYLPTDTATKYVLRGGRVLAGDESEINVWRYGPGFHEMRGGPEVPIPVTSVHQGNLKRFFVSEIEVTRTDDVDNPVIVSFTREARR